MARTKTEETLLAAEEAHADDPERAELFARARRFKSSWIELGEALSLSRKSGSFKRWGYASLEDYAKAELFLRADTVEKLTGSFLFLKKSAPEVLERSGVDARIPTYQAVDFLRRAEESEAAPEEAVAEIRKRVIEDNAPLPAVAKQFREVVFPRGPDERKRDDVAGLRNVGRRLSELVEASEALPEDVAAEVARALKRMLDRLDQDEIAAA